MDSGRDLSGKTPEVETIFPRDNRKRGDGKPRPVVDLNQLTFRRVLLKSQGVADVPLLGAAYECWSKVWQQTFRELTASTHLPSDEFTRQDEVGAIFHGYECVALFLSRHLDFSLPSTQADSYFSIWPQQAREAACFHGSRICLSSNITIPAAWRRPANCSLSLLLCALIVENFLATDCDVLVGTMRVDLRMNTLAYSVGAVPLKQGLIRHGVLVDLVAFYRTTCVRPTLDLDTEALVHQLYPKI